MAWVPGEQGLLPSRGPRAVGSGSIVDRDSGVRALGQVRGAGSSLAPNREVAEMLLT